MPWHRVWLYSGLGVVAGRERATGSTAAEGARPLRAGDWECGGPGRERAVLRECLRGLFSREVSAGPSAEGKAGENAPPAVAWLDRSKNAPHLRHRRALVEWLVLTCEHFRLGLATFSAAVRLCDRVLGPISLPKASLQLVAMGSLLIAAKMEETERNVPPLEELAGMGDNQYSADLLRRMEAALLQELRWDVVAVTPAHFVDAFLGLSGGGTFPSDTIEGQPWDPVAMEYLEKYAIFFTVQCLVDMDLLGSSKWRLSHVAASIVAASRFQLHIFPIWPQQLEALSTYSVHDLWGCIRLIMRKFEANHEQLVRAYFPETPPAGSDKMMCAADASPKGPLERMEDLYDTLSPSPSPSLEAGPGARAWKADGAGARGSTARGTAGVDRGTARRQPLAELNGNAEGGEGCRGGRLFE